ncbi:MAG: hypothetical protein EXR50_06300 [Dehalococcoidia bacterium]|nr:hypothetical protein [Dehalococcoidia bacterium]
MSTFYQTIGIAARQDGPFIELEALVDTGSTYTWVPSPLLNRLGIEPTERRLFDTADGRVIEREIAEVPVRLDGRIYFSLVVSGNRGTMPLLGATTLEDFGLGVDPVRKRLIPVRGLAMSATPDIAHPFGKR